jgi:hypothetical protein
MRSSSEGYPKLARLFSLFSCRMGEGLFAMLYGLLVEGGILITVVCDGSSKSRWVWRLIGDRMESSTKPLSGTYPRRS